MRLARGQGTSNDLLSGYLLAQKINRAAGGAVIAPWEVQSLPDDWIEAAQMLTDETPQMSKGVQQVEDIKTRWRTEHRKRNG